MSASADKFVGAQRTWEKFARNPVVSFRMCCKVALLFSCIFTVRMRTLEGSVVLVDHHMSAKISAYVDL